MEPYFDDGTVAIYLGDCREVVPALALKPAMALVDPPYNQTSLEWDRWPEGWLDAMGCVSSMWVWGTMRMFMERAADFAGWTMAQDIVWEKHNGSSFHTDRFRRVHEQAVHFYRGPWADVHKEPRYTNDATARAVRRKKRPPHMGHIERSHYKSQDGGPRLMRSVLQARSCHGKALHPTQKPEAVLVPLIEYSCPPEGLVLDPMMGAGSTLVSAMSVGRKAVGIEVSERYCEVAARRLDQGVLPLSG